MITAFSLLAICLFTLSASPQSKPQQWEYKVSVKKCGDEKNLNALGAEGWELATYSQWPVGLSTVDTCVFKRPKS